jgi:protein TonB
VFLVIQPSGFGPASASFFFHDGDGKMAELSLMEFPFDPSLLAGEERDRLRRSQLARLPSAPVPAPLPQRRRPGNGRRIAVAVGSLLLLLILGALIGVNLRFLREWWLARARVERVAPVAVAPQAAAAADISIGLRAKRENGDVEISWNRNSPVIAAAQSGVLSIQDGRAKREIVLDATQVRNSSIVYAPTSEQVSLQLAITTEVSTLIESVILFLPKNGPPAVYPAPTPAATRPLKPFTLPSAAAAGPANAPAPEPALPSVEIAAASAPVPSALAAQPTAAAPPSASEATPGTPAVARGTTPYRPAEPLRRVVPRFPAESLRTISTPLTVEVQVAIDGGGKVTQAALVSQRGINQLVAERILGAARQWTFTPARRGDDPVASEFVLQFRIAR